MKEKYVVTIEPETCRALVKTEWWKNKSNLNIVRVQLFCANLLTDFQRYHEACEVILRRPIFTHEFAYQGRLVEEFLVRFPLPTAVEIFAILGLQAV